MRSIEALSLGWRTELIFHRFDGEVIPRADHLLVRTPHNPTFYWGNFLLFDRPPHAGEAERWVALFDSEIAQRQSASRHLAFGIDGNPDFELPGDFAALGITRYSSIVLTMRAPQLRELHKPLQAGFRIRPLRLPQEAPLAVNLQVASDAHGYEPAGYRVFRERQMARYGRMGAAGLGRWFGIFAEAEGRETLVADCGLFRDGPGPKALGRFQFVSTHPAWRRRGLCTALIHAVCRHGFEEMGLESLVIIADPDDVAIGLYESVGFVRDHRMEYLERRPAADRADRTGDTDA